ncbi:hypothetical protein [Chryseobacterium rhizosphaerae]|uniref:Uncharacterized protein n=1 Tax=Chryseobacterium rhizosphaerae TaxID=395937 RepID=A0ABX9IJ08_9FLAO|nr:hypothetical protein [Chryseobacterium rhizosphaerae]REC73982.1 hypothetical protein DRF57_15525 [Chryseobacterium rhizosphaerae]GEN67351.1 hypothetical protein CRH01_19190 [Chryseobacterium rhizosphaerae]
MFPFTYTFEREIINDKTSENVIYTAREILREKKIKNILYGPGFVSFNEGFLKERSNWDYLSFIDDGKFTYNEKSKVLTYKVKLWKFNLFALAFLIITLIYFEGLFGKLLPLFGLIVNHLFCYFGSQGLIKEITHEINYLS